MAKDYLGDDQRRVAKGDSDKKEKSFVSLDEADIGLMKRYSATMYADQLKDLDDRIQSTLKKINLRLGVGETVTGRASADMWDMAADEMTLKQEQPLIVANCTRVWTGEEGDRRHVVNIKQFGRFVVSLDDRVAPADVSEGMRVGVERGKYQIALPLPSKIDPTVTLMQVEDKPDVTYADVGGCVTQIEKLREVVEMPLIDPTRYARLGIEPPRGVLLYGPPGTGKTLCARAVSNRTGACFIRVSCSELVQKYVGEGARLVRDIFELARTHRAAIIFFDEIDAIGGARFDDGIGGDNEVQRTMLELICQLDGFDPRGNIKVLMATNRPDTLDPALVRPGRIDRRIEFALPDLDGRAQQLRIFTAPMRCARYIRFDLIARLCPNVTGAELRSVCTEAGMLAIRQRRKSIEESDFLEAVNKVVRGYAKFSSTPKYLTHN